MLAFFVGCARSGTSILGELLAQHPAVNYLGEQNQHLWHKWYQRDHHRLYGDDATSEIKTALRDHFEGLPGDLVVDKCPPNSLRVPFLAAVFPGAIFIHIIRDGRDVACSLMPGIGGESWNHLKPPAWRALMMDCQGIERCARLWQMVVETTLDDLKQIKPRHFTINYEDLVRQPALVLNALQYHLRLPFSPEMVRFSEKIQDETAGSYHAQGQDTWYRDNHSRRVGRWKENLTEGQQKLVNRILKHTLIKLGYEV